jgi:hypothetical protein
MKNLLKVLAVGALVYGAYKLGEKQGEKKLSSPKPLNDEIQDADIESNSEVDEVLESINQIQNKPNKTKKDRDILDLLKIKLDQLTKKL